MERILIVEDSATQREVLRHTLVSQGYEVISAADGREGWLRVEGAKPTIVITDIVMPEMDGYQLCRAIKQDARFAGIPVVLLTSLSDPKDVVAALECGADGFIGKPFAEEYLVSRIRGIIANRDLPARDRRERGVEISHEGRSYLITAERQQILDLLLSVYEVAMRRNNDLAKAQESLRRLNAELEQKVRDRTRKLEESNKALETFCYSVAHDLRAPLRSIQGYVSVLSEEYASGLDETARNYADRVCGAAARMDKMILDLLAYGRVSHSETSMEHVDVRTEMENVLAELSEEIAAKQATIITEVPPLKIWSSRVLMGQILGNLLGNALKFVRPGEPPKVRIEAAAAGEGVRITIEDQGIGIDPVYRDKIFRVFEKLHSGAFPGTGIGLAIVQKAVERLGGRISVESEQGRGSRFTVDLPGGMPS